MNPRALLTALGLILGLVPQADAALSLSAPSIGNFAPVQLSGRTLTTTASVGTWSVDATGVLGGWHVDVKATQFENGSGHVLPLRSMTYRGPSIAGASGQLLTSYPTALLSRLAPAPIDLSASGTSSVNVLNALALTGQGKWDLSQGSSDLSLTIPSSAAAGTYTSTITFTLSPGPL